MTCLACSHARTAPELCRLFADHCLHCAARRIQYIQRVLQLGATATQARCRKALADATERGLPEVEVRKLAKLADWQVAPLDDTAPQQSKRGKK